MRFRAFLLVVVASATAIGWFADVDRPGKGPLMTRGGEVLPSVSANQWRHQRGAGQSIAAWPDRGGLVAYDGERHVIRAGASTWYPVQISEAHALRGIAEGGMTVRMPNGEFARLKYQRHVEHPDGNWTWIGSQEGAAPGNESLVTFGDKAVFGVIHQGNKDFKLTTEAGSTWVVDSAQAQGSRLVEANDALTLSAPASVGARKPLTASDAQIRQLDVATAQGAPVTVDVAMGFTTGFAARLGGESQARTRLNYLVDVTNQAYVASGINAQIRLVRALQVDYPDATLNRTALFELTGVTCTEQSDGAHYMSASRWNCTSVAQPASLQPLIAARDSYGADLMVLMRKFEAPEQTSCGTAWMLGGGQNPIDQNSAAFATSVVSDSSGEMFPDEGATCPEVHLAHELGHNMGQQHDVVTARGSDDSDNDGNLLDPEEYGRHPYSFGYSTDDTGADIATIMSNRRISQTRYRVFSNPLISSCGGAPCGTADQADNARSMNEVMPNVAAFRASTVPSGGLAADVNADGKDDVLWFNPATKELYFWLMDGPRLSLRRSGGFAPPNAVPRAIADVDGDDRADILLASGQDIWIYLGNSSGTFSSAYLAAYPVGWDLVGMGDVDADGKADVVWHNPATRELYYWLLDGAMIRLRRGGVTTPAGTVPRLGDLNGDHRADVILSSTGDNWVYLSNASGGFASNYIAGYPSGWNLVGTKDIDADGKDDLLWHHPGTGELYYWLMNGGAIVMRRGGVLTPPGASPSIVADFDGDGRADVFLPSSEHVWTYQANASGTFTSSYTAAYPAGWY